MNTVRLDQQEYKKPLITLQQKLNKNEIEDKLYDYEEVKDISKVKLQTHIRYFIFKEDPVKHNIKKLFRLGGYLVNKENADKYVVLSNGKNTWSVQVKNTIFYRKLDSQDIIDKYTDQIADLKLEVENLNEKVIKYKKELGRLRKLLDNNRIKY